MSETVHAAFMPASGVAVRVTFPFIVAQRSSGSAHVPPTDGFVSFSVVCTLSPEIR